MCNNEGNSSLYLAQLRQLFLRYCEKLPTSSTGTVAESEGCITSVITAVVHSLPRLHRSPSYPSPWPMLTFLSAQGWFRKGEALFALNQYEEAERAYKKAVDLVSKADGE